MRGHRTPPQARCAAFAQEAKALKHDASGPAKGPKDPNAAKLSKGPSGPLLFVKYEPCELSWPVSASG